MRLIALLETDRVEYKLERWQFHFPQPQARLAMASAILAFYAGLFRHITFGMQQPWVVCLFVLVWYPHAAFSVYLSVSIPKNHLLF